MTGQGELMPWEGASDVYRECYFHGGIPTLPFNHNWQRLVSFSLTQVEDMEAGMRNHPLIDDYWRSKVADWSRIEIPTYAVTGWPNDLHLRGTIEAWRDIASPHKYLDIHGGKEWAEFYSDIRPPEIVPRSLPEGNRQRCADVVQGAPGTASRRQRVEVP